MSKPTVATLKAFIHKNRAQLLVKCKSEFDAQIDGCSYNKGAEFQPAKEADRPFENNLGISGIWLVGRSRDYITPLQAEGVVGFHVYNCCGSFDVAVQAA